MAHDVHDAQQRTWPTCTQACRGRFSVDYSPRAALRVFSSEQLDDHIAHHRPRCAQPAALHGYLVTIRPPLGWTAVTTASPKVKMCQHMVPTHPCRRDNHTLFFSQRTSCTQLFFRAGYWNWAKKSGLRPARLHISRNFFVKASHCKFQLQCLQNVYKGQFGAHPC